MIGPWIMSAVFLALAAGSARDAFRFFRRGRKWLALGDSLVSVLLVYWAFATPFDFSRAETLVISISLAAASLVPMETWSKLLGAKEPQEIESGTQESDRQLKD